MHELGITRGIVEIAERHARAQGAMRIVSVRVEIGELAGVLAEAVAFCFESCAADTLAAGARLYIDRIPGRGRCGDCGAEIPLAPQSFSCPYCGSFALQRLQGEELRVTELEIDGHVH